MLTALAFSSLNLAWLGCLLLALAGAAVQVAVGAGLSVVCGPLLMLWLGPAAGVPILLCLNLLVSVVATGLGGLRLRWGDVALASGAILAGCLAASLLPDLSPPVLKGMTACVLVAIALPRPPARAAPPSAGSARAGVGLAALATGALTVWTATPGPITPVALARAGRTGAEIRRAMQPISIVGFGAALAWVGLPAAGTPGLAVLATLAAATLLGTGLGFRLRTRLDPARVVVLIRIVAGVAALLLVVSLLP
ncbi:hypothetical protein E0493_00590 [Roseomonas sp. M0104]|uniref:Uncharacterized protein n=1 Tax=Teichococcus coralli TaxID=2545983 RepID=A0A845B6W8_9PROT|nr:hypothetical protein [Pseudoroseomonas coralli]MXP61846.1 hypothetical protein [Pseudoroseomonas coralli]